MAKATNLSAQATTCVYCGGAGMSREHYFGAWLNKIRPAKTGTTNVRMSLYRTTRKTYITPTVRARNGGNFSKNVRCVCVACNGGWLSSIQSSAKPLVLRLMNDEVFVLQRKDICSLSRWIVNATMLGELDDRPHAAVPPDDFEHFYVTKDPPATWRIYIGRHAADHWQDRYFHLGAHATSIDQLTDEVKRPRPNTQLTVFTVGAMVVVVTSALREEVRLKLIPGFAERFFVRLWPDPPEHVSWPQTFLAGNSELDLFQEAYAALLPVPR